MRRDVLGTIICLIVAFSVSVAPAYAFLGHKDKGKSKDGDLESKFFYKAGFLLKHDEEIGLTGEQKTKVESLKMEVEKNLIRKDAEIEILGLDIKSALKADDANLEAINALVDQKYELKKQKTKDLVAAYLQLKSLLTDEQKEKKKALYSEKHKKKDSE